MSILTVIRLKNVRIRVQVFTLRRPEQLFQFYQIIHKTKKTLGNLYGLVGVQRVNILIKNINIENMFRPVQSNHVNKRMRLYIYKITPREVPKFA